MNLCKIDNRTYFLSNQTLTDDSQKMLWRLFVGGSPVGLVLGAAVDVPVVLHLLDGEEKALLDVALLMDLGRALEPDVGRSHLAVGVLGGPVGTRPIAETFS